MFHRNHIITFYHSSEVLYACMDLPNGYHDLNICYYEWPLVNLNKSKVLTQTARIFKSL